MQITVNVNEVDLTAAIGERYDSESESRVPATLGDAVAQEITRNLMVHDDWRGAKEMVRRIREEEIRAAVKAEIAAALTEPVQQTNTWGEAAGAVTTLRQRIADQAKESLTRTRDGYGQNENVVLKVVREEVDRALTAELKEAVAAEKAKVVAAVRLKAAELIATAVKEGVGR